MEEPENPQLQVRGRKYWGRTAAGRKGSETQQQAMVPESIMGGLLLAWVIHGLRARSEL